MDLPTADKEQSAAFIVSVLFLPHVLFCLVLFRGSVCFEFPFTTSGLSFRCSAVS